MNDSKQFKIYGSEIFYLFGAVTLSIAVGITYYGFSSLELPLAIVLSLVIMSVMIKVTYITINSITNTWTISQVGIVKNNLLGKWVLTNDEVLGFEKHKHFYHIFPNRQELPKIKVSAYVNDEKEFSEWLTNNFNEFKPNETHFHSTFKDRSFDKIKLKVRILNSIGFIIGIATFLNFHSNKLLSLTSDNLSTYSDIGASFF